MTGAQQIEMTVGKAAPMRVMPANQQLTFRAMARPVPTIRALSRPDKCRHPTADGAAATCRQCHHHSSGKPSAKRARDRLYGAMPLAITDWATKAPTPHKTPASRTPPQARAADVLVFMKKVPHPCACPQGLIAKKEQACQLKAARRSGRTWLSRLRSPASSRVHYRASEGGRKLEIHERHHSDWQRGFTAL